MNPNNIHNNKTNKAWERLHSRLDAEGLIPAQRLIIPNGSTPNKTNNSRLKKPLFKYTIATAAAVVVLITLALNLWTNTNFYSNNSIIKLSNKEEQAISVATLKDGSTIYMASKTSISYSKSFSETKRKISLQGDAYFEITSNQNSPFIVDAPNFTIKVLGTSFIVNYDTKGTPAVSVESGKVTITLKTTGEEKILAAGESTSIQKQTFTINNSKSSKSFFTKTNKLHFKDQILKDVVKVLNKKYPGSSIILSPIAEQRIITATFSGESPESMAQMICIALGLKYIKQEGTITIYE